MNNIEQKYNKILNDIKNGKRISPLKAIRFWCLDCCGFVPNEVQTCLPEECILHSFRFGKNTTGKRGQEKKMGTEDKNRLTKSNLNSK